MVVGLQENIEIDQIGSYIKYALESKDNDCTSLACGIISDLSGSMGERMNEYLDDFVPCLHNILRDEGSDRKIKLPAFHALGDLCMYSGDAFNRKYLDDTLTILSMAARMSTQTQVAVDTDPLLSNFLSELREVIIDQYIIILMAASDSNSLPKLSPYLSTIFDFLEATVRIEGYTNTNIIKMIIGLLGDIATHFPQDNEVKSKSTMPYIEQGILVLQQ